MSRTILVVDDEQRIVELARDYLEHAGFRVVTANDGRTALEMTRRDRPDLVVLDLGLPGLDGLDVTRELRKDGSIPIVMVTARDDELDKLLGLELGADDYLTKPFSPRELVARVKAVLRRADRPRALLVSQELLRRAGVNVDRITLGDHDYVVVRRKLPLTPSGDGARGVKPIRRSTPRGRCPKA